MVEYTEDVYRAVYKEIVKRIGGLTTETITMMTEDDFPKFEPRESVDRLVTPMLGLFGKILTSGLLRDALSSTISSKDIEGIIKDLKIA